jgi:hypothetical protein
MRLYKSWWSFHVGSAHMALSITGLHRGTESSGTQGSNVPSRWAGKQPGAGVALQHPMEAWRTRSCAGGIAIELLRAMGDAPVFQTEGTPDLVRYEFGGADQAEWETSQVEPFAEVMQAAH